MSTSSWVIVPPVGWMSRRIIRPIVDFPLPLSPITERTWPVSTWKVTSRTAVSLPRPKEPTRYVLVT